MRWQPAIFLVLLTGCAGKVLLPGASHEGASLITSTEDFPIWVRPSFGHGRDTWSITKAQGIWVMEGDFLVQDCYSVLDGTTPQEHVHAMPGRHYLVGCDKDNRATFVDIGAAPH